ncbi:reverse transcriptase domain-containing protein [Tanacetum coccineum]
MNISKIKVKVDSKLVASQINGSYEANKDNMVKYLAKAKECISGFKSFSIENIPRNMNQKADVLSKLASVSFNHLTKEVLVEVLKERSMECQEVHTIVEEEGDNWMTPIIRCSVEGIWPEDRNEARCLRAKIGQYTMKSDEIHMGSCDMHVGPRAVVRKAIRQGYYWPTMHEDAKEEVQKCMDILGPLPPAKGGAKFVIVAIDYLTKWLEAKPLEKRETATIREARNEASRVEDQGKLGLKWEGPYMVMESYENGSYKLQTLEDKEVPRTWHAINLRKCYL